MRIRVSEHKPCTVRKEIGSCRLKSVFRERLKVTSMSDGDFYAHEKSVSIPEAETDRERI